MNYFVIPGLKYKNQIRFQSQYIGKEIIIQSVLDYFKLSFRELRRKDRSTNIKFPRQVVMYLLKKNTSMKLKNIGAIFDFDHSTVIHAVKKIQDLMDTDEIVRKQILDIENKF